MIRRWFWWVLVAFILLVSNWMQIWDLVLVDGPSMQPTLRQGECLLVWHWPGYVPRRGDVIVFHTEDHRELVKRVIGLPEDTVAIVDGNLVRNGRWITEPYAKIPAQEDYAPERVAPNQLFVMGDNRPESEDSRSPLVGEVPLNNVEGQGIVVLWRPRLVR